MGERKDITAATLKKVEDFLKKQKEPIFKADIVKKIGVDLYSLKLALEMLKIKPDKDGKIHG